MSIRDLPPELLSAVLALVDDRDFVSCLKAARLFHLDESAAYEARVARWQGCVTAVDFCRAGNIDALQRLWQRGAIESAHLKAMTETGVKNDLADVIAWLCDHYPECADMAAADFYNLGARVLSLLIARYPDAVRKEAHGIVHYGTYFGRLDVVVLMDRADLGGFDYHPMDVAAGHTRLDILVYLHRHRPNTATTDALAYAAANGDLAMVRFLCAHRDDGCYEMAIRWAAHGGHVEIMDLIRRRYPEITCGNDALPLAAHHDHLDAVIWLHAPGRAPCVRGLVYHAGERVEAWLVANRCMCNDEPRVFDQEDSDDCEDNDEKDDDRNNTNGGDNAENEAESDEADGRSDDDDDDDQDGYSEDEHDCDFDFLYDSEVNDEDESHRDHTASMLRARPPVPDADLL
ncbi:Ankyrin repeat domain containing protein [Pandoravirus neocaledonia]|uniref:Ankyrin repeat domain containing protein n=1 Tax=Pandoravirus neocaledonia TaxID=2107708 RepID=A0A2U7UDZ2_9VIRU|nr:Ankyrin repeat domain containing protein [Pandoravirus neocaledonia]AVK76654.1 Ankyrin repeat domain containing protein [Pandoravirus neocaledonia]